MKVIYVLPGFLILFLMVALFAAVQTEQEEMEMPVKIGDMAPEFKLKDDAGNQRTLSEFRGRKVVLYFYPKDDTPGCTKEACSFRDSYALYEENDIVVLGVSYDSPESHRKFKEKYDLPFTLLSDENKEVSKTYGAKGLLVAKRMTFLIDEEGKIVHIFSKVDVTQHADEVLQAFAHRDE